VRYHLIAITHGEREPLAATLDSFWKKVSPAPKEMTLVWDGCELSPPDIEEEARQWDDLIYSQPQVGFCETAISAWAEASQSDCDYVFWLEHDFEFLRAVDLRQLAQRLSDSEGILTQMSLLREPANSTEIRAGGLPLVSPLEWSNFSAGDECWMTQRLYWTTNPSLIPQGVFRDFAFPQGPECEGKLTIEMRNQGHAFGVWGDGEPWIRHTGKRDGFGY
jgi:hypothetical protein